jgi:hypothetical protein
MEPHFGESRSERQGTVCETHDQIITSDLFFLGELMIGSPTGWQVEKGISEHYGYPVH